MYIKYDLFHKAKKAKRSNTAGKMNIQTTINKL